MKPTATIASNSMYRQPSLRAVEHHQSGGPDHNQTSEARLHIDPHGTVSNELELKRRKSEVGGDREIAAANLGLSQGRLPEA